MTRHRRIAAMLVLLLVLSFGLPTASAQIGMQGGNIGLGKVDPGHESTHQRTVSNSGTERVTLETTVTCGCRVYVSVEPQRFELAPGQSRTLEVQVKVAADADPGIHDNIITIAPTSDTKSGGTGINAQSLGVTFQVRSAKLYLNPPSSDEVPARFINAYEEDLQVTLSGSITGNGLTRDVAPIEVTAKGHEGRSRTTTVAVPLPLGAGDPAGLYTVALYASWQNTTTDTTGSSGPHRVEVAHGALVALRSFEAKQTSAGLQLTAHLRSLSTVPVETWLAAALTQQDGGEPFTAEGTPVSLGPGEEGTVTALWQVPETGTYTVRAQAAYETAEGAVGWSSAWPAQEVAATRTSDSGAPSPPDEDEAPGADPAPDAGNPTLLAIVALVGVGMGAGMAILVNRRGRKE